MLDLRLLDVGGGGDCFFKYVSYQLYSNADNHLDIRAAGIQYLRKHLERFIVILSHKFGERIFFFKLKN